MAKQGSRRVAKGRKSDIAGPAVKAADMVLSVFEATKAATGFDPDAPWPLSS